MRSESERREKVQQKADSLEEFKTDEAISKFLTGLESMPITELQRLKDDEEYRNDTTFSMQVTMKMLKKKDMIEDKTAKKAKDNIDNAERLIGDIEVYNETIHPNYTEIQSKAQEILAEHGDTFQSFTREGHAKVLNSVANEKYKESEKMAKNFNRNNEPDNVN